MQLVIQTTHLHDVHVATVDYCFRTALDLRQRNTTLTQLFT